jgi:hypothetical protein
MRGNAAVPTVRPEDPNVGDLVRIQSVLFPRPDVIEAFRVRDPKVLRCAGKVGIVLSSERIASKPGRMRFGPSPEWTWCKVQFDDCELGFFAFELVVVERALTR